MVLIHYHDTKCGYDKVPPAHEPWNYLWGHILHYQNGALPAPSNQHYSYMDPGSQCGKLLQEKTN